LVFFVPVERKITNCNAVVVMFCFFAPRSHPQTQLANGTKTNRWRWRKPENKNLRDGNGYFIS
jgi:hypothetical protein